MSMSRTGERASRQATPDAHAPLDASGPIPQPGGQVWRGNRTLWIILGRVGLLLAIVAVWQIGYDLQWIDSMVARSPGQVFGAFVDLWTSGEMGANLLSTLEATLIAFVIASVVGIFLGILMGMLRTVDALLDPFVDAMNSLPRIALAPIFIILFGIGQTSKIALAFTLVVFILFMNARSGVRAADADVIQMATVFNANKAQMLFKVLIPGSVPAIFAGLRLGMIYSLLAVVASEMIASREGLGQLITKSSALFQMEYVYAAVLMLTLVAVVLNRGMSAGETHLLKWQIR